MLVLDEPTANLDPPGARRLLRAASQRSATGATTTIVLIEHRVELAWPLADLVLALDRRRAARSTSGSPADGRRALGRAACATPGSGCRPRSSRAASRGDALRIGRRRTPAARRPARPADRGARDLSLRATSAAARSSATCRSRSSRASASRSSARTAAASRRSAGCSSACCGPAAGRCGSAADDPGAPPAGRAGPPGGLRLPGSRAPVPDRARRATRSCSGSIRPRDRGAPEALLDRPRAAARAVRRPQPVPAVGRRGAPAVAGVRARPRPAACSSSTSRRSARIARTYEALRRDPRRAPRGRGDADRGNPRRAVRRATSRIGVSRRWPDGRSPRDERRP